MQALFMLAEVRLFRNTRRFILSDVEPNQEESIFYTEAKTLKFLVDNLTWGKFDKKLLIKLLDHGSYRAVQRKIRIATLAMTMPELKKLNLGDAEGRIKDRMTRWCRNFYD